jgi:hypothetical protein
MEADEVLLIFGKALSRVLDSQEECMKMRTCLNAVIFRCTYTLKRVELSDDARREIEDIRSIAQTTLEEAFE